MADAITTKNITSVDEVQSVDNTDKVFVNDNGSFKQISVSNLMKQAPSGVTEETDPTVSEWAKQPTKPSYTADEVGALPVGTKIPTKTSDLTNDSGYLTQIPEEYVTETELGQKGYVIEDDIPEKLPSPGILTFTGAVNDTYDGSVNKTINIPTGGGEGGTSDYNALANKPKLNGVEIAGNKTSADYKIVSSEQGIENNGKFLGVGVDGNVTPVDKPTYTADEVGARPDTWTPSAEDVGALPNNTEIPSKTSDLENDSGFITNSDIPEKLPNPQKIIFTGAVSAEYDGSSQQTINIPTGGGGGGTTNYNNLSNKPQLNGVTLEGNKTLDQVGVLAKNQGSSNSGKYLSVGSDGNVVPADAPSGGTVDPEQIKQAVNGYLEENPVSGMTAEQEQQLEQNTTDVADLKNELPYVDASTVAEMTNEKRLYRYTGSEEGYITGSLYYHDGTKWVQIGEEKKIEVNEELNSVDLWKNSVESEKETTDYIDKETTKVINNDPDNYYVWMVMYNSSGKKFAYRTEDGKTPTIKNESNSITNFDYTKYQNDGYNYKILISRRDSKTITLSMALSAVSIIKEYTEKITEYLLPVSQKNTQDIRELKIVLVEDGGIKGNNLADSSVTESKIADKAITPNKTSFFSYEHIETKNLFDSTKIKEGVWLNGNTGYKDSSSTPALKVACTDYIPVTPGLKYLNLGVSSDGWWYDSEFNPLQKCSIVYNNESFGTYGYVYSFGIAPENAAYLSCNVEIKRIDTFMIWQGENAQELIWESGSKYEYKFTDDGIRSLIMSVASAGVNNLQGKTWLVIGDSITNFPNGSYRQLIAETYGATVLSAYADGRRVSFGADKQSNYCTPYLFSQGNMPSQKPDIITILLGTNDYGNDSPIGNISDDENSQSVDSYSFIGCYKWMLKQLHDKYGHVPTILITPFHRKNGNTENGAAHTLVDYAHAIKEIGEYYSYPVCDMYSESGLPADMFEGYTGDGLHLTAESHKIVAPKIYKIMNEQLSTI